MIKKLMKNFQIFLWSIFMENLFDHNPEMCIRGNKPWWILTGINLNEWYNNCWSDCFGQWKPMKADLFSNASDAIDVSDASNASDARFLTAVKGVDYTDLMCYSVANPHICQQFCASLFFTAVSQAYLPSMIIRVELVRICLCHWLWNSLHYPLASTALSH